MRLPSDDALSRERARRSYRAPGGLYRFTRDAWEHTKDPTSTFSDAWHLEVVCSILEDLTARRRRKHALTLPPSTGKSMITGVMWPAWTWACVKPSEQYFFASYDDDLLNKATRKLFNLLRSSWFIDLFGRVLPDTEVPVSDFQTLHRGGRINTSFGGTGTGHHGSVNVIDDPVKAQDAAAVSGLALTQAWQTIAEVYASRTNDASTYVRLLVMQRLALGDPIAKAIEAGWSYTRLPMLFEADNADPLDRRTVDGESLDTKRFPPDEIESLKRDANAAGTGAWDTQYQLNPRPKGGSIINPAWMNLTCSFDEVPSGLTIQSWDLTFGKSDGSDFVAGQWWRAAYVDDVRKYFHLSEDPVNKRMEYTETRRALRERRALWPASRALVENKANGPAIESDLRDAMPGFIEMVNPDGSKAARMMSCADDFQQGNVIFVRGAYLERWRREYPAFPRVARDDEEDATSQAINWLRRSDLFGEAMRAVRRGGLG